jgi:hypothetical protein
MANSNLIYPLELFNTITFNGFNYELPEETLNIILKLSSEVGAPNYVKTPIFQKKDNSKISLANENIDTVFINKKKKINKHMEIINNSEWDNLKKSHPIKEEHKSGIILYIDTIRTYLNKVTDKNYNDYKVKILELIEKIQADINSHEELAQLSSILFDIASTNRFYSKLYADLYTEIITKFNFMRDPFDNSLNKFSELFNNIEYIDPSVDYDKYCKINKDNEKRRAISSFFINLMNNGIISKSIIIEFTRTVVSNIYKFISMENKKNEVDELSEIVSILYTKDIFEDDDGDMDYEQIHGYTITEIIETIAKAQVKNYSSLTKKTCFKFMDLLDL